GLMDAEAIAETLEALAQDDVARRAGRMVQTLRGIRGVPQAEVARIAAAAWEEDPPRLPDDEDLLARLYGNAWEDGLVAIGLLAAALPDTPADALQIGLDWCTRIDDAPSGDA